MIPCNVVGCYREATVTSLRLDPTPTTCAAHAYYYGVVLADSYYRDHPVPGGPPKGRGPWQLRLLP